MIRADPVLTPSVLDLQAHRPTEEGVRVLPAQLTFQPTVDAGSSAAHTWLIRWEDHR